jgi:hypothetical protein
MTQASQNATSTTPRAAGAGYLFGVPVGDLGWFTSLIMGVAIGFAAFFASTFCGIIGILIYNSVTHHAVDFTLSYRRIGLPVGVVVLVLALAYLGTMWVRRQIRRA